MSALSDASVARIVSHVTETMLGMTFKVSERPGWLPTLLKRTAFLSVGKGELVLGLSSDEAGCAQLGAALFSCPAASVDRAMMNDSLSELLNMTAGQIKVAMRVDHALGLPEIKAAESHLGSANARIIHVSSPAVEMLVWIIEPDREKE